MYSNIGLLDYIEKYSSVGVSITDLKAINLRHAIDEFESKWSSMQNKIEVRGLM